MFHTGGAQQQVQLAALSHPSAAGVLTLEIVADNPFDFYTVEFRQSDGWDSGRALTAFWFTK